MTVQAFTLSPLQVESALGEPFRGQMIVSDLGNLPASAIRAGLASQIDQNTLGARSSAYARQLQFSVRPLGNGRALILIQGSQPFNEPYLDVSLRVQAGNQQQVQPVTALIDLRPAAVNVLSSDPARDDVPALPPPMMTANFSQPTGAGTLRLQSGEIPLLPSAELPPDLQQDLAALLLPASPAIPVVTPALSPALPVPPATPLQNLSDRIQPVPAAFTFNEPETPVAVTAPETALRPASATSTLSQSPAPAMAAPTVLLPLPPAVLPTVSSPANSPAPAVPELATSITTAPAPPVRVAAVASSPAVSPVPAVSLAAVEPALAVLPAEPVRSAGTLTPPEVMPSAEAMPSAEIILPVEPASPVLAAAPVAVNRQATRTTTATRATTARRTASARKTTAVKQARPVARNRSTTRTVRQNKMPVTAKNARPVTSRRMPPRKMSARRTQTQRLSVVTDSGLLAGSRTTAMPIQRELTTLHSQLQGYQHKLSQQNARLAQLNELLRQKRAQAASQATGLPR